MNRMNYVNDIYALITFVLLLKTRRKDKEPIINNDLESKLMQVYEIPFVAFSLLMHILSFLS